MPIKKVKIIVGATEWDKAEPGSIRGDYGTSTGENLIHCTDPNADNPQELVEIEIKRFFGRKKLNLILFKYIVR